MVPSRAEAQVRTGFEDDPTALRDIHHRCVRETPITLGTGALTPERRRP
ncbi:hypothetical protein P3L51_21555 [Streptomyces sp. PSRA5]